MLFEIRTKIEHSNSQRVIIIPTTEILKHNKSQKKRII